MNNSILQVKLQQRVNKLSSSDYSNIECWMAAEAFNKAMDAWVSRQLEGINQTKSTAEGSIRSIDKLQVILVDAPVTMMDKGIYWEGTIPDNYNEWSRISTNAIANCCPPRKMTVFLGEQADLDIYLADKNREPDFEWATTFASIIDSTIRIYTNGKFEIATPILTYYRKPLHIQIAGCVDPDTGLDVLTDVECEFRDSDIENIIDEAAAVLSADMDNYQKLQELNQNAERNN